MEMLGGRSARSKPPWGVIVHGPSADSHRVVELAAHQIVLRQNVIAKHPAAAALAGHHAYPIQGEVVAIGMIATVLDVIPNVHHDAEQFKADLFIFANRVFAAAPFNPPVAVLPGL